MNQTATIYTIAHDLNLHPSTVSRALNDSELVRPQVRECVKRRASEVNYQPNRSARNLTSNRTQLVGLLVPDVENPVFPPMIHATQKAASENGLDILLLDSDLNVIREAELIQRIRSQVDGIIMASPMGPGGKLQAALRQTPAILVNRISKRFPCVLFDHTEALRQAGATLKSFGHDRIALLRGPQTSWVVAQRAGAVLQWAKNARVEIIDLGNYAASYAGGLDAAAALAHKGATAAFAFDDLMACGVLAGLKKQGVSVPTSFSLVGCDDVLLSSIVTPSLTTIRGPMTDLSNMAVTSLLRLIGNEVSPEYRVTIPGQLVMRESVGVPGTIHEYLLP